MCNYVRDDSVCYTNIGSQLNVKEVWTVWNEREEKTQVGDAWTWMVHAAYVLGIHYWLKISRCRSCQLNVLSLSLEKKKTCLGVQGVFHAIHFPLVEKRQCHFLSG